MKSLTKIGLKLVAFIGLGITLKLAFQETGLGENSYVDVRAALLVFIAPVLILILFQKEALSLSVLLGRWRQISARNNEELLKELEEQTPTARGPFGYSHIVKMSESHPDSMIQFAGEIYSARFSSEELAQLLTRRSQAEDQQWGTLYSSLSFLAKMAPYFGMMATVIGMVKLLENMADFSKIGPSMTLAMQGTLYGLMSFLMAYSPLQRLCQEIRNQIVQRNEMIIRWFILVSEQTDPTFIQQELHAHSIEGLSASGLKAGSSRSRSTRSAS